MSESEKSNNYIGDVTRTYSSDAGKGDKYRSVNKNKYDSNYDRINWSQWYVYILKCKDNTLYCGITNDLDKRIKAHNNGSGAKYTTGRKPVELVYKEKCLNKSEALKREKQIKKMKKEQKLWMINGFQCMENSNMATVTDL